MADSLRSGSERSSISHRSHLPSLRSHRPTVNRFKKFHGLLLFERSLLMTSSSTIACSFRGELSTELPGRNSSCFLGDSRVLLSFLGASSGRSSSWHSAEQYPYTCPLLPTARGFSHPGFIHFWGIKGEINLLREAAQPTFDS